jgi:hypothetical protein
MPRRMASAIVTNPPWARNARRLIPTRSLLIDLGNAVKNKHRNQNGHAIDGRMPAFGPQN